MWISNLLNINYKVQNYTKMQTKRDIEKKIRKWCYVAVKLCRTLSCSICYVPLTYDITQLEVMNSWPTNENDAGQILTVALSVLLDVCVGEEGVIVS
jgi:hypothetical protein